MYLAKIDPRKAWTLDQQLAADAVDSVERFLQMESDAKTTDGARRIQRPWDEYVDGLRRQALEKKKQKARSVRAVLEGTVWVDVEVDDVSNR